MTRKAKVAKTRAKRAAGTRCHRANALWVAEFEDGRSTPKEPIWTLCAFLARNPELRVTRLQAFWKERATNFTVTVPHDGVPFSDPPHPIFVEGHIVCRDAETLLMRRLLEMEIAGAAPVVLRPDPEPVIRARAAGMLPQGCPLTSRRLSG